MLSHQTLLRLFRLIRLLNTRPSKNVDQLSTLLDTTPRTIYRYLKVLESVGYLLDKDSNNRYFLIRPYDQQAQQLLSDEEAYYLQDMLQQATGGHPVAEGIIAKINRSHTLVPLADSLPARHQYQHVQLLTEAIQRGHRVKLCKYHSTNSGQIADRIVEPIHFSDGYTYLFAFDVDRNATRQFKVERMERVEWLDQTFERQHPPCQVDVFGFSGRESHQVELQLNDRAYRLLREEFPRALSFVKPIRENQFLFQAQVYDLRGVSRFILGLPGQIKVVSPLMLIEHLRQELQRFHFYSSSEEGMAEK